MSLDHHHDEHGDKLLESEDFQKARREMRRTLWRPGVRPDNQVGITRRIFIHRALLGGTAAAAATAGWLPRINTMDMAYAQEGGAHRDVQVRLDLGHASPIPRRSTPASSRRPCARSTTSRRWTRPPTS